VATSEPPVRPFWLAAAGARATDATLPVHAEVAVLGAGIAGCIAALTLARAGVRVAVLDARHPGEGATGRSAGFLIRGTADHPVHVAASLGEERTLELWQYTVASLDALIALVESERMSCGLRRPGGLVLALDADEARDLEDSARLVSRVEPPGEIWTAAEVEHRTGFAGFTAGWFRPDDALLDPAQLCTALAAAAERAGACIVPGVRVLQVDDAPRAPLRIHTERGVMRADRALLAVNATLPSLASSWADVITPVRAQMHVTTPDLRGASLPWPVYAHHGYEYWRQEPTGELLIGGHAASEEEMGIGTYSMTVRHEIAPQLARLLARFHPSLRDARVVRVWAGLLDFASLEIPMAGALPASDGTPLPGAYLVCGLTGHGLPYSAILALLVSELISSSTPRTLPLDPFDPQRYVGAAHQPTWLAPFEGGLG
jgi:gamma-glutamylputrescine oxidase